MTDTSLKAIWGRCSDGCRVTVTTMLGLAIAYPVAAVVLRLF